MGEQKRHKVVLRGFLTLCSGVTLMVLQDHKQCQGLNQNCPIGSHMQIPYCISSLALGISDFGAITLTHNLM